MALAPGERVGSKAVGEHVMSSAPVTLTRHSRSLSEQNRGNGFEHSPGYIGRVSRVPLAKRRRLFNLWTNMR